MVTTIEDVVQHVKDTEGWYLTVTSAIRRSINNVDYVIYSCPVSSLQNETCTFYAQVAANLRLSQDDAHLIAVAADNTQKSLIKHFPGIYSDLRERLLKAAGLEELEE
jgi:hypothetical protein